MRPPPVRSRQERYSDLDIVNWRARANEDLDENDRWHDTFQKRLEAIQHYFIGFMIGLATASILLALNLIISKG